MNHIQLSVTLKSVQNILGLVSTVFFMNICIPECMSISQNGKICHSCLFGKWGWICRMLIWMMCWSRGKTLQSCYTHNQPKLLAIGYMPLTLSYHGGLHHRSEILMSKSRPRLSAMKTPLPMNYGVQWLPFTQWRTQVIKRFWSGTMRNQYWKSRLIQLTA